VLIKKEYKEKLNEKNLKLKNPITKIKNIYGWAPLKEVKKKHSQYIIIQNRNCPM
jgi:hypothetical protein